jgi:hypothetical protein
LRRLATVPRWVSLPVFALGIALVKWLDLIGRDAMLVIGTGASFEAFYLWRAWARRSDTPDDTTPSLRPERVTEIRRKALGE